MAITKDFLNELITCPKAIYRKPMAKMQSINGYLRNDFDVVCQSNNERFHIFMRQNSMIPENFSVGLTWKNTVDNRDVVIFRCNGPHGGNKKYAFHYKFHTHTLNLDFYNESDTPVENDTVITEEYSTFSGAIYYFCRKCHIIDAGKYFPEMNEVSLFTDEEVSL